MLLCLSNYLKLSISMKFLWCTPPLKGNKLNFRAPYFSFSGVLLQRGATILTTSYPPGLSWPSHGPEVARLLRICHEPGLPPASALMNPEPEPELGAGAAHGLWVMNPAETPTIREMFRVKPTPRSPLIIPGVFQDQELL